MKRFFTYLQPFLRVLSFFGCYILLTTVTVGVLIPLLGHINPAETSPEEMARLQSSSLMLLLVQLSSLISLLFTLFIFIRIPPAKDYVGLGLTGEGVLKDIGLGCLAGAGIIGISFLVLFLSGVVSSVELNEAFTGRELLVWLLIYLVVAFVEELMFRGYFLNVFMDRYPPLVSLLVTSLFFGLMHFLNPSFGWLGFVNIFLAGLLMGLVFFFRRNIWLPLGIHFGWNFVQGTILGFNVSGIDAENLLHLQLEGSALMSGGDFGLEGSLVTTAVCLAAITLIWYYGRLSFQPVEFEENEPG